MKPLAITRPKVLLAAGIAIFLTSCSSGGNSGPTNTALNLAGTWSATLVSTQGKGTANGTATVAQSGTGLGVNGTTTLSVSGVEADVTQTGTALTGTIGNAQRSTSYPFKGTLSSGNLTLTGSSPCDVLHGSATLTVTIMGSITSSTLKGTYNIARPYPCNGQGDAGTFTAMKQ